MLKRTLLFILLNIYFQFSFSQQKNDTINRVNLKLDNNLSGILSNGKVNSIGIFYSGNNSITKKYISLDLVTSYNNIFNKKLIENEFSQKSTLEIDKIKWNTFITHQYNYSLLREIKSENFIGVGLGFKKNYDSIRFGLSYAILYQNSDFFVTSSEYIWRHSIRIRYKIEKNNFNFQNEWFYQPGILKFSDYIIYGTTRINLFSDKKINFVLQDIINFRNFSVLRLIHNLTIGIGIKISKF